MLTLTDVFIVRCTDIQLIHLVLKSVHKHQIVDRQDNARQASLLAAGSSAEY
jgi:uncharacterized protein YqgQ